jgi:two-component system, chemotaxis family, protein-glutamate methylesterase/glutaminase
VPNKIKVLIVDDSGYVISVVSRKLETDPDIEVIGSARNGKEAVEKVKSLKPDVVTMDVIMPDMDGLTALEIIMAKCPTPVVMLSAITSENADTTIKALELGAVDFYLKPSVISPAGATNNHDVLISKIKAAATAHVAVKGASLGREESALGGKNKEITEFDKLVVIGSSTGGPRALMQLIPALPADIPAAFLLVQHMPPLFTRSLAERLDQISKIKVAEARDKNKICRGTALLAPGDFHMLADKTGRVKLNQEPEVLGVRPSINITMKSAARVFGKSVLGVILTGMGTDGTEGASRIKESGGKIIAQDESTSAVFGMPQNVIKTGCVDQVLPLSEIAAGIVEACKN